MSIDLENIAGFGVAGNFANHLEQAGESEDFINVEVDEADAPKGIFPFYLKGFDGFISNFPLSSTSIVEKKGENIQMEPEVALICDVVYKDGLVSKLTPTHFTAYNDCSIRRKGAKKISEKKNWGAHTKGFSEDLIAIDFFSDGGVMDDYNIASFIKRDNKLIAYGVDSQAVGYSFFYEKLITWLENKFASQTDHGPLENISQYLKSVDFPTRFMISIGATRYTEFGETNFLNVGDELYVILYNRRYEDETSVQKKLADNQIDALHESCSLLLQKVIKE
jgi:hypothetical protein